MILLKMKINKVNTLKNMDNLMVWDNHPFLTIRTKWQRPLAERIVSALINVLGPRAQYITPITTVSELFDLCDYFNDPILHDVVCKSLEINKFQY